MTTKQRQALKVFDARNAGSLRVRCTWVWRDDVRRSEEIAEMVLREHEARS